MKLAGIEVRGVPLILQQQQQIYVYVYMHVCVVCINL